ncbi:MAG: hypothetical protein AB1641_09855 [Thermodesulfobacteriota bacterium]
MSERLMLRGALAEKNRRRMDLAAQAEGLIRSLKMHLLPASAVPLRDIRMHEVLALAHTLHETWDQYMTLLREIEDLERELA